MKVTYTGGNGEFSAAEKTRLEAKLAKLGKMIADDEDSYRYLIESIRKELGASILVIEHDMPMVMSISDRIYCLEAGCVIAEGDPMSIRNNPAVIASYLGTDERAIARSDS